ncbi:hypothetical protein O181_006153 [Austropuccinia psidii MF-1]|uniref:Reverse transcriptase Ty1/copia-type domain-containing protein n=1 Tax=Austropuccinia psidii MF-1 TaxID=1389203 RepID=A0A9Q3BJX7_9BASI|nr:hypothetical protein [Austropuccinia psidii MF-1]
MKIRPLTKDIIIPKNLGQALSGKLWDKLKAECKEELEQMRVRNVWEAVDRVKNMKTSGHCWVLNIKHQENRSVKKFKACFVAWGDFQRPGVDCTETYTPTTSLMSLCLLLAHGVWNHWPLASFNGIVALSTCATEYVALSDSTQHLVQEIIQLTQLAGNFEKEIFCDNQGAVQVPIDNQSPKRM